MGVETLPMQLGMLVSRGTDAGGRHVAGSDIPVVISAPGTWEHSRASADNRSSLCSCFDHQQNVVCWRFMALASQL